MKNNQFIERLEEAMSTKRIKPAELARAMNVSKATISRYLSGIMQPAGQNLVKMANILDVSPAWLVGENVAGADEEYYDLINDVKAVKLTKEERDLIEQYRNAEPILRKSARIILDTSEEEPEGE
ncbi:MAG: helix-turn-helix transcriptional regulator [Solobacterium sp.]|nr:helix-turn-helix transcriptional regulator [Solobacterium sp.]